jgi:nucleosome assembly protein 1-like 1
MSQNQNITSRENLDVAPTPQNTPLDTAVLANRPANLGRPQVEDIGEGEDEDEDVSGMNPASLLAQVGLFVITIHATLFGSR